MVAYQVVKEAVENREVGAYTTFGVCAYRVENTQKEELVRISDVFLSTEVAQWFVDMCNKLQLDVIHLPEVIDDMLQAG